MRKPTKDYKKDLFERLQDKEYAAAYLNAALDDEDPKALLIALKDVTNACGEGVTELVKETHFNRESLYHNRK